MPSQAATLDTKLHAIRAARRELLKGLSGPGSQQENELKALKRQALRTISAHISELGRRMAKEGRMESLREDQQMIADALKDLHEESTP
tara:strand:- start:36 stop:302 length:267 start_codon:yes stop_codon:yes gene_type:complete